MKLIVISPETEDPREHPVLAQLFTAGLTHYHLRKPAWNRDRLAAWLRAVPAEFHPRIVAHAHHDLAVDFNIGGLHFRDADGPLSILLRSRAVHDLATLRVSLNHYDRLLFSPVFPSISKPGRNPDPRISSDELKTILAGPRRTEAIALGGIDRSRLPACRSLGFDGVAVLGAVWHAADPIRAFTELQHALLAHAA